MLAGGSHVGVDEGLDRRVNVGMLAVPAVLRRVVGAFHVLHARGDVDESAVLVGAIAERGVVRDAIECEVDLGGDALEAEALDRVDEICRQLARIGDLQEGTTRIERAHHDGGPEFRAVVEHDATHLATLGDEAGDVRVEADLRSVRRRRAREHLGEAAVAALVEGPGSAEAVMLAHGEVEPVDARPRRHRPELDADARGRADRRLDDVGLEVVVDEVGDASREQADGVVQELLVGIAEMLDEPGHALGVSGIIAEEIGRDAVEKWPDELPYA